MFSRSLTERKHCAMADIWCGGIEKLKCRSIRGSSLESEKSLRIARGNSSSSNPRKSGDQSPDDETNCRHVSSHRVVSPENSEQQRRGAGQRGAGTSQPTNGPLAQRAVNVSPAQLNHDRNHDLDCTCDNSNELSYGNKEAQKLQRPRCRT